MIFCLSVNIDHLIKCKLCNICKTLTGNGKSKYYLYILIVNKCIIRCTILTTENSFENDSILLLNYCKVYAEALFKICTIKGMLHSLLTRTHFMFILITVTQFVFLLGQQFLSALSTLEPHLSGLQMMQISGSTFVKYKDNNL